MSEELLFTLSTVSKQGLLIAGKERHYDFLKKLVRVQEVQPDGEIRGHPAFKLETIESAYHQYAADKGQAEDVDEDDMVELRKEKLVTEIAKNKKDIETKDLEIKKLKDTLIDTQEVSDFLSSRRAVELAIVRKILFTQVPVEVPGETIPGARKKSTHYYNELLSAYQQTETLWTDQYGSTPDGELEKKIANIIYKVEQSGSVVVPVSGSVSGSFFITGSQV